MFKPTDVNESDVGLRTDPELFCALPDGGGRRGSPSEL